MANTQIYVKLDGQKQLIATLNRVSSRGKNLKPWLEKSAKIVMTSIKDNFRTAGALLDKPWAARKRNYGWEILNKTGAMKGAFKADISSKKAVIGNTDKKFPFHQLGTRRGLPKREMLGMTAADSAEIAQNLREYLTEGKK